MRLKKSKLFFIFLFSLFLHDCSYIPLGHYFLLDYELAKCFKDNADLPEASYTLKYHLEADTSAKYCHGMTPYLYEGAPLYENFYARINPKNNCSLQIVVRVRCPSSGQSTVCDKNMLVAPEASAIKDGAVFANALTNEQNITLKNSLPKITYVGPETEIEEKCRSNEEL